MGIGTPREQNDSRCVECFLRESERKKQIVANLYRSPLLNSVPINLLSPLLCFMCVTVDVGRAVVFPQLSHGIRTFSLFSGDLGFKMTLPAHRGSGEVGVGSHGELREEVGSWFIWRWASSSCS